MKICFFRLITVITFLSFACNLFAQAPALIIKKSDGTEVITDSDRSEIGSGAWNIKRVEPAEGFIFPAQVNRKKQYQPAEKILTGVYSSRRRQNTGVESKVVGQPQFFANTDKDLDSAISGTSEEKKTLAWFSRDTDLYHDSFLECGSHSAKIWVKDIAGLTGLEPCSDCFHKNNLAPAFIRQECGGLDLATAGVLLDNPGFLAWLEEHLPVKKAVFLTSRKLLIYPKQEMSSEALHELAHETAMAYRRHTWKVIEVLAKKNETDLENISSF